MFFHLLRVAAILNIEFFIIITSRTLQNRLPDNETNNKHI